MKRGLAVSVAAALMLAVAGPVVAFSILQTADQTGNGVADTWTLDDNGDGRVDRLLIDGNEDGSAEVTLAVDVNGRITGAWADSNLDRVVDLVAVPYYANGGTGALVGKLLWYDRDQNGAYEAAYYDGDLDGYFEWVLVDTNSDGHADSWRANAAPAGRSATDAIARQMASSQAVAILRAAYLPVFFPTTTIPMGG